MSKSLEQGITDLTGKKIVLDASALLNLLATEQPEVILEHLGASFYITGLVEKEITKNPRTREKEDGLVAPLVGTGRLSIVSIEEHDEIIETFMDLTKGGLRESLDDGEASSIAYAFQHGLSLALDEKKARNLCEERFNGLELYYSIELFQSFHHTLVEEKKEQSIQALYSALKHGRMAIPLDRHISWCRDILSIEMTEELFLSNRLRKRTPIKLT